MRTMFAMMLLATCLFGAACGEDDPKTNGDGGSDADSDTDADSGFDAGAQCPPGAVTYDEDVSGCTPAATDYMPRENGSADDSWEACISDDDTYHEIEASVSSIARVQAYEDIGDLLWRKAEPAASDFLDARVLYEADEGLDSRVVRRFDPHYDAPDTLSCEDEGVPEQYPDYCVGPATLQPALIAAFADGSEGKDVIVNAARIEAALQWFFYVSIYKEATTCAETPKDCDSSWAYYCGGRERDAPIGLAAEIDEWAPETHDRTYDGVLAVRCWRDLDEAVPAADTAMQERARGQLDTALVRGMAILARQKLAELDCAKGDHRRAALEWLRVVVPLLDRETRARDAGEADLLMDEVARDAADVDVAGATAAIDATYPCP
ncbi:MAG: hypothetical protein PHU25_00825 [Deltaproteobacteria bacterium]|nr:hypothetical protein [Deltaproteobacteria bacterium]